MLDSDVPYSPSFLLNLHGEVESRMENVIDFVFMPGKLLRILITILH